MSDTEAPEEKHISGFQQERLLEAWLVKNGYPEVDRRKGATGLVTVEDDNGKQKTFTQKRDIFGCIDLVAMGKYIWMIQATTHGGSAHRRKKIEKRKWPVGLVENGTLRISIFTHSATQDPSDLRKWLHCWRVQDLRYDVSEGSCYWMAWQEIPFDIKELEVEKREVSEDDKAEAARIVALPPEEKEAAIKALKKARKKWKKA